MKNFNLKINHHSLSMYRMLADAEVAEKIPSSQENFFLLEERYHFSLFWIRQKKKSEYSFLIKRNGKCK